MSSRHHIISAEISWQKHAICRTVCYDPFAAFAKKSLNGKIWKTRRFAKNINLGSACWILTNSSDLPFLSGWNCLRTALVDHGSPLKNKKMMLLSELRRETSLQKHLQWKIDKSSRSGGARTRPVFCRLLKFWDVKQGRWVRVNCAPSARVICTPGRLNSQWKHFGHPELGKKIPIMFASHPHWHGQIFAVLPKLQSEKHPSCIQLHRADA